MSMNASFLPEDYLARKLARRSNIVCVSLFAVVLTGVLGAYFVKLRQLQVAAKENGTVNAEVDAEAAKIDQATKLQQQHQEMMLKASITSALIDPVDKSNVLAELINHMPATLSLTELNLETEVVRDGPRPSSALAKDTLKTQASKKPAIEIPRTQVNIEMVGVAPTDLEVSQYMTALNQHPLFDDVTLGISEQYHLNDTEMRKFKVKLRLSEELTMAELQPTRRSRDIDANPLGDTMTIGPNGPTPR